MSPSGRGFPQHQPPPSLTPSPGPAARFSPQTFAQIDAHDGFGARSLLWALRAWGAQGAQRAFHPSMRLGMDRWGASLQLAHLEVKELAIPPQTHQHRPASKKVSSLPAFLPCRPCRCSTHIDTRHDLIQVAVENQHRLAVGTWQPWAQLWQTNPRQDGKRQSGAPAGESQPDWANGERLVSVCVGEKGGCIPLAKRICGA
jgi:hypothetical protein